MLTSNKVLELDPEDLEGSFKALTIPRTSNPSGLNLNLALFEWVKDDGYLFFINKEEHSDPESEDEGDWADQ